MMRRVVRLRAQKYIYIYNRHPCMLPCVAFTGLHEMLWKNLGAETLVVEAKDERLELDYSVPR